MQTHDIGKAIGRVFLQAPQNHGLEIGRDLPAGNSQWRYRLFQVRDHQVVGRLALKWRTARQQEIAYGAQAVDVAASVHLRASGCLLGRQISGCARDEALEAQLLPTRLSQGSVDQSEVKKLQHIRNASQLGGDEVARLQVAVDQAHPMGLMEGRAGSSEEVDRAIRRQGAESLDQVL